MILDRISQLHLYEQLIPGASSVMEAFAAEDPSGCETEVREKAYALRPDEARRFEVHARTIDLMIAREGAEMIHLAPADRLETAEALPGNADGFKMNGSPQGTGVLLEAGYFCAIFPGEAHMVGGKTEGAEDIRKWVVKVPAPCSFQTEVNA